MGSVACLIVAGALGVCAGSFVTRWLRTSAHRYDDEADLRSLNFRPVPILMALAVALVALGQWRAGGILQSVGYAAITIALVTVAAIDADVHRLPDAFTKPLTVAAVVVTASCALLQGNWSSFGRALLAGAVLGAVYLALVLLGAGTGFGLGDAKLAPTIGILTGYLSWSAVLGASVVCLLSSGVVAAVMLARGAGRKATLAFGPHMVVGAVAIFATAT